MRVRTIKEHSNSHGDVYQKKVGTTYEVDDHEGENLVAMGLVEEAKEKKAK